MNQHEERCFEGGNWGNGYKIHPNSRFVKIILRELCVQRMGVSHIVVFFFGSIDGYRRRDDDDMRAVHREARCLFIELHILQNGVENGEWR